jgi:hypothetical protein
VFRQQLPRLAGLPPISDESFDQRSENAVRTAAVVPSLARLWSQMKALNATFMHPPFFKCAKGAREL